MSMMKRLKRRVRRPSKLVPVKKPRSLALHRVRMARRAFRTATIEERFAIYKANKLCIISE